MTTLSTFQAFPIDTKFKVVAALLLAFATTTFCGLYSRRNRRGIARSKERVLIIGGSSGIGRAFANCYASRGARVCVVGRRSDALDKVKSECLSLRPRTSNPEEADPVMAIVADFANAEDMIRLREILSQVWSGVDTIIVSAGVSALRPLLEVSGVHHKGYQLNADDVKKTVEVSDAAIRGNHTGPLVSAITLIPLLEASSPSPSLLLVSSFAALVPLPTRSLYCSTKASSLLLYQSLAIEHPEITFTYAIPGTVRGNFRASAVDQGPVREVDPDKHGLDPGYVARRCVEAVDARQREVLVPYWPCTFGHWLYWLFPGVAGRMARKKYNFRNA